MATVIGIVADEKVDSKWVHCLLRLRSHSDIVQVFMVEGGPGNFDVARNKVVTAFLSTEADHLLTLDTDMMFTPDQYEALRDRDVPVVSACYFVADTPPRPVFSRRDETGALRTVTDWEDGLIEVDACGGGFMLIQRDTLTGIGGPDADRCGPWYRQSAVGASGSVLEPDHAFCQRVQQGGGKVYVDTSVLVGHIKPRVLGWETP